MDTPCICTVFMSATSKPKLYNPRHPERTLLYQTVAEHYETWVTIPRQSRGHSGCEPLKAAVRGR